ncbi:MAG: zinc-binding dehydrogenase [Verrucomicrobia bacterium]|nr:zinc-binding dehydrogenase [Verrucomicrobiota bacterium]
MRAVVFDKIGSPADVLELREMPVPEIGDHEVLIRMVAASVNPGDFLFIENLYPEPKKPVFPDQIAGNHGAGVVVKVGPKVAIETGTLVAFSYYNAWAEYAAVPAQWLIPLPAWTPIEVAAQFVNPITAWDLLNESAVQSGGWLGLTAGNSAVSTMVLNFANLRKIKVIAIVRAQLEQLDLKAWGAAEVIELKTLGRGLSEKIAAITGQNGVNAVIDCVGGAIAGDLIRSLAVGGQFIIYGGFSSETFSLHNFDVLMRGAAIKSYVYRYFFHPPAADDRKLLHEIADVCAQPEFKVRIGGVHALDDFKVAIHEALSRPHFGKRLLKMSDL